MNIKSVTDFGIFVELDGGIDGLIHHSEIVDGPERFKKNINQAIRLQFQFLEWIQKEKGFHYLWFHRKTLNISLQL